jgi:hypothetical protein
MRKMLLEALINKAQLKGGHRSPREAFHRIQDRPRVQRRVWLCRALHSDCSSVGPLQIVLTLTEQLTVVQAKRITCWV